jgi:predicted transposase
VNLAAQLKLDPTTEQAIALGRTLVASNAACDYISGIAWDSKTFRQFDLHRLCYRTARERFGLSAQAAIRCISKVADAYRLDRKAKRTFRPMGSAAYDQRILSYDLEASTVSSRECSACGHVEKRNRPNQSTFRCVACGFAAHADTNAARVIAGRAAVSGPNVASCAAV